MKFKKYLLNEVRSKSIEEDDIKKLILQNCKNYLRDYKNNKKPQIYRGIKSDKAFLYIDPTKGKPRKSAHTKNYYTLIIDNSELWKDYPKRSKSLICSDSRMQVMGYGHSYNVFPYDNAKFGVCPNYDIWSSWHTINGGLDELNDQIRKTVSHVANIKKFDNNIKELKNALNKTSEILNDKMQKLKSRKDISDKDKQKKWFRDYNLRNIQEIKNYLLKTFKNNKEIDIFKWLKYEILVPESNGFTTKLLIDNSRSREIWIGNAPCILIDANYTEDTMIQELLNEI